MTGRITVEIAGQWIHEDQEQIAHALTSRPSGSGSSTRPSAAPLGGGRTCPSRSSWPWPPKSSTSGASTGPIRSQWSREESIVGHHKRHRGEITARLGATRDGRIVAVEADCYLDAGGYNYTTNKVLGNLHLCVAGPYEVPNARIDSYGVYTNGPVGGAFRGFGAPQGAMVAETQMNKLARALGHGPGGAPPPQCPAGRIVRDHPGRDAGGGEPDPGHRRRPPPPPTADDDTSAPSALGTLPENRDGLRRGRGFACAYKNIGFSFGFPERCEAFIELHGDDDIDRVVLFHGAAEVGQGAHTALKQMAAEATGVSVERVETVYSDTATIRRFGVGLGLAPDLDVGQRDPGGGGGGRQEVARRRPPGPRRVPLRAAADRGPRPGDRAGPTQLRLWLCRRGGRPDGRYRDGPHQSRPGDLRRRRRAG